MKTDIIELLLKILEGVLYLVLVALVSYIAATALAGFYNRQLAIQEHLNQIQEQLDRIEVGEPQCQSLDNEPP